MTADLGLCVVPAGLGHCVCRAHVPGTKNQEAVTMRNNQRPVIFELPLIAAGLVVATLATTAAGAMLWSVRELLHVTRLDRSAGHA